MWELSERTGWKFRSDPDGLQDSQGESTTARRLSRQYPLSSSLLRTLEPLDKEEIDALLEEEVEEENEEHAESVGGTPSNKAGSSSSSHVFSAVNKRLSTSRGRLFPTFRGPYVQRPGTATTGTRRKVSVQLLNVEAEEAISNWLHLSHYGDSAIERVRQSLHKLSLEHKKMIAAHMKEDDIIQVLAFWTHFDYDHNGILDPHEFRALFSSIVSTSGVEELFNSTDLDGSHSVDFGEFLVALARFLNGDESGGTSQMQAMEDIGLRHLMALLRTERAQFHFHDCFANVLFWMTGPIILLPILYMSQRCCSRCRRKPYCRIFRLERIVPFAPHLSPLISHMLSVLSWSGWFLSYMCTYANRDPMQLYMAYVLLISVLAGFGLLQPLVTTGTTGNAIPQQRSLRTVIENPDQRKQHRHHHGYTKVVLLKQAGSLWRSDPALSSSCRLPEDSESLADESYVYDSKNVKSENLKRQHLRTVASRLAISATQSIPASRYFQAAELGSPTTLKHQEWHHRSTLIFFKTETAGRCQTAQGVFNEILETQRLHHLKTNIHEGKAALGLCICLAVFRCALVEIWSIWAPGPSSTAATLFRVANTTVDFPAQASYAVIDPSHSVMSPVGGIWIAAWVLRLVTSILMYTVIVHFTLLMALDFLASNERLVLLGNTVSPELSLRDNLPFLNLQIWENVIAFVTLRSYIEGIFHRETFSLISCGISFVAVVVGFETLTLVNEYAFVVFPTAETIEEALDARRVMLFFDTCVAGLLLFFFSHVAHMIDESKAHHIKTLSHERWQLEAKSRRTTESARNRFQSVAASLSEAIAMIERSDEGVSLFGFTLSGAVRGYLAAFVFAWISFVGMYFYKLQVLAPKGHDLF